MPLGATFEPEGGGATQTIAAFDRGQSLMQRAEQNRRLAQQQELQMAEQQIMLPVKVAQAKAQITKAQAEVDGMVQTSDAEQQAYSILPKARTDFNYVMNLPDANARAKAAVEYLSRYSQMENIKALEPEFKRNNEIATKLVLQARGISGLTSELQTFAGMTEGFTPEEKAQAQRVATGVAPRPSSAAITYKEVMGPDGKPRLVAVDPREVGAQVIGTGESFGSGVGPQGTMRSGASPDTFTGKSDAEIAGGKAEAERQVALKAERAKRESGLKSAESATKQVAEDIDRMMENVSATTVGPLGLAGSLVPGTPAYGFKAEMDALLGRISSQALVAMRLASPTGGALGNVSDRDIKLLENAVGAIKQGMSPEQFKAALSRVKERLAETLDNQKHYFDEQFKDDKPDNAGSGVKILSVKRLE